MDDFLNNTFWIFRNATTVPYMFSGNGQNSDDKFDKAVNFP